MKNLQVNQMENQRPAMEQEQVKFTRTLYDAWGDKKIWCFRQYLGKSNWGSQYGSEYYCYGCKNELIFRWKDEREAQGYPPFRVHELFIEFKEKVNEYGRTVKQSYNYALCCKCANQKAESPKKGIWKIWAGRNRKFEIEKCDCLTWINQEREKYLKDKNEHLDKYNTLTDLIDSMEAMKDKKKWNDEETYKDNKLKWIIKDLEKDREHETKMISYNRRNVNQLNDWEIALKGIINE